MKSLFSDKGVAAVEMALILPLLLAITFGLIEFGFLMYNQQVITNAAREGARRGIVQHVPHIQPTEIEKTVHDYADSHLVTFGGATLPSITVETNGMAGAVCTGFGDDLAVTVTYPYTFLVVPNFIPGLAGLLTLSSEAVMKCE